MSQPDTPSKVRRRYSEVVAMYSNGWRDLWRKAGFLLSRFFFNTYQAEIISLGFFPLQLERLHLLRKISALYRSRVNAIHGIRSL